MANITDVQRVGINDLIPYENNTKKHPEKQLKQLEASIQEFGFISPVLIDKDNNIIAGHGRVMAAKALGYTEVPCVRIEGLTEQQKRAYIIADNRLTELGGWDKDLLANELSVLDIEDFKIDLTGFNIDDVNDIQMKIDKPYGAERSRTLSAYNLDKVEDVNIGNDYWQMPVIKNDGFIPGNLIGFNYAKTSKDKKNGIHFFIDDYQFERIWNYPEKYIEILSEYECVLSPEFSLYWEMPLPMKIWNTYRNRFIGSLFQQNGIKVIPSICWADEATFDFCFCGVEKGSIVAVETNGVKEKEETLQRWKAGMTELIKRIEPSTILIYGGKIDFDYGDINVIYYDNQVLKKWKERNNAET